MNSDKMQFHIEETKKHKNKVENYLGLISKILERRGRVHDDSKLENVENEIFAVYSSKLKDCTYGSDEYKLYLEEMKPALSHHYKNNRHHPEHFKDGIREMNLIDIMEMLMDWLAASKRHDNGNIMKSIELNMSRFGYGEEISSILKNTIKYMNGYGMEAVEDLFKEDDNENVKTIVHEWMTGKSIDIDKYEKKYNKEDVKNALDIVLSLCSMGLG